MLLTIIFVIFDLLNHQPTPAAMTTALTAALLELNAAKDARLAAALQRPVSLALRADAVRRVAAAELAYAAA